MYTLDKLKSKHLVVKNEVKQMRIKLFVVSNLVFLFYKSMACAIFLREIIIFTAIFHIVCISHYKSIKQIDDNFYKKIIEAKSKQNCNLPAHYTTEDKRV